jgi:hypothetical protein
MDHILQVKQVSSQIPFAHVIFIPSTHVNQVFIISINAIQSHIIPHGVNHIYVRHGYPWVLTDQAPGRHRQVGPAYQKTRRRDSGPNRSGL